MLNVPLLPTLMLTFDTFPLVKVTVPASGTTGVVAFPCFTTAGPPARSKVPCTVPCAGCTSAPQLATRTAARRSAPYRQLIPAASARAHAYEPLAHPATASASRTTEPSSQL